jgi:hypothetical protein
MLQWKNVEARKQLKEMLLNADALEFYRKELRSKDIINLSLSDEDEGAFLLLV